MPTAQVIEEFQNDAGDWFEHKRRTINADTFENMKRRRPALSSDYLTITYGDRTKTEVRRISGVCGEQMYVRRTTAWV